MSILIKGMEMPKHAGVNEDKDTVYRCIVIAHPDNSAELVIDTEFASPYDNGHNVKRYPLVEVPTPHGRLIDADAYQYSGDLIDEHIQSSERRASMSKRIIDVCCGSKMFWFDKDNADVEFCDIRELSKTEYYPGRFIEISPDTVCDFTNLPFESNSFYLAVFDPPHLQWAGDTSIMALKYGKLKGDWRAMLTAGFNECMRVLRPNGVLIFKWSEIQFPLSEILPLFSQKPLFGNRMIKRGNKTHWLAFMKAR